nr:reverse transcriptase domain-containing protein [Tanacetum cinerariifolium]
MQEATEMATGLMDKKIRTYAERQATNKRKFKDTSRNNQGLQQPPKRQDMERAYDAGSDNRQQYAGSRPLCPKCNFNHDGPCIPRCYKCNKIGHLARDYFMKCKPWNFKGTEGVVELTQWYEKMKTVLRISNCSVENQIKFSTCTLLGSTLTWWNSHVMTVGPDVAYVMTWVDLKKRMTDKYYPRGDMKKLESELWNLRVKSNDVVSYNQRFQELSLLCVRMFPEEADKIERYVDGLPDVIHRSVVASRPKTMQEAIKMANELMDKKNNTWAESQAENKRKVDDTSSSNQIQRQQQNKRQNTGMAYTVGSGKKKLYAGSKPLCPK